MSGRYFGNRINHTDPICNLAENGISGISGAGVQKIIVYQINEKLRCRRIWCTGSRHGNCAAKVGKAGSSLIHHWCKCLFAHKARFKSTTLNHESRNDPMENSAVIKTTANILQEVAHGFRRHIWPELQFERPFTGQNPYLWEVLGSAVNLFFSMGTGYEEYQADSRNKGRDHTACGFYDVCHFWSALMVSGWRVYCNNQSVLLFETRCYQIAVVYQEP